MTPHIYREIERKRLVAGVLAYGLAILTMVAFLVAICGGCLAPVTVNVFSSRMVISYGTNAVSQRIDGGATTTPNVGLNGDAAIKEAGSVAKGMLVVPVAGEALQGGVEGLLKAKQIDMMAK